MASILSIGQSALAAAQVGLTTTGHNIANANTPGYSRQVVVQGTSSAQDSGFGFVGKGTAVVGVKRIYNEYLSTRVLSAQTSKNELSTYYSQIKQINNLFADSTSGLSPALQDFFKGVQNLAAAPNSGPARDTMLSMSETLASQFQSLDGQLREMNDGVNTQINASVGTINSYAKQIAQLNDAIEKAQAGAEGKPANDLLDQRDQVVAELSKEIKVNVVKQGDSYSVFIGSGQPLVVGTKPFNLVPTTSATDLGRAEVGYVSNGTTVTLAENALTGGKLGGLVEFRAKTLDVAQNSLGRVAIGLAATFNAQHRLGQDLNGNLGGGFFTAGGPMSTVSSANSTSSTGKVAAAISDVSALTTSDYRVQYDGTNINVTRLSDGKLTSTNLAGLGGAPLTVDGVDFTMNGTPVAGDLFLVRPTATGAADFKVAIKDKAAIAAATPIRTIAGSIVGGVVVNNNTGSGAISAGTITSSYTAGTVTPSVTLTYSAPTVTPNSANTGNAVIGFNVSDASAVQNSDYRLDYDGTNYTITRLSDNVGVFSGAALPTTVDGIDFSTSSGTIAAGDSFVIDARKKLTGFPSSLPVTVTTNGSPITFAAGAPVLYTEGATISVGGVNFTLSGAPANGDTFTIGKNAGGVGDNRNMLQLAALQTSNTLDNNSSTYQGAYGQLVNLVGNKTHELAVTSSVEEKLLTQATEAQQGESGVNLDEEATNLLRYQQAYQAAGKVMQTASKLFDLLLSLGQ